MSQKIVIIGGIAGGMSAATRLRRQDENAEIIVVEQWPDVSFANCGLPYYISGEISDHDSLLLQTPESLKTRFNLDVRVQNTVVKIDPEHNTVRVKYPKGTEDISYDSLIISSGASLFIPPLKHMEGHNNIFTLRNVADLDRIMSFVDTGNPQTATVIGGEDGKSVVLDSGGKIPSDMIFLAVGVRPETRLATEAGISTHPNGGICVDQQYRTNYSNIYAVGDVITVDNLVSHEGTLIPLASPANRQGRYVADVLTGAQVLGVDGADKRIDILATAIKAGLTVQDLPELELAYAPPSSSAKDPVNMVGYVALNIVEGASSNVQWHELEHAVESGVQILDVRNEQEIAANGALRGAVNIPLDSLRESLDALDNQQEYIVSCQSGLRSYLAERALRQEGFSVRNLDGAFSVVSRMLPHMVVSAS